MRVCRAVVAFQFRAQVCTLVNDLARQFYWNIMPALFEYGAERVLICDQQGNTIDSRQDALDVIGDALGLGATLIAIPVIRLSPAFFDLRSGLAGEIAQVAVNYRQKLAVVGNISEHVERSNALRDWVVECNRRNDLWFVATVEELRDRLTSR